MAIRQGVQERVFGARVGDLVYVALEERVPVREVTPVSQAVVPAPPGQEIAPERVHPPGEVIAESVGAALPRRESLPAACGREGGLRASPEVS